MRPERWQQLDQLFHSALEREPSARVAFLDEACCGDDSLHREVQALLAGYEEAGSFIEQPAFEVEARAVAEDQNQLSVGQTIGHYQIVSLLGAGGMGEVYLAEDMTLGRKVALKLLPADFSRDTDRVRRFQQEARAASALNHPNIVTVHEIAHVGDRHLIATEFIDGETLRARIRAHDSGGAMPTREVLNVGIQIADALAAAHEVGIVHRDIKPENIMVRRRDGYIKVLDFGLAKLTPVGFGDGVDGEAATRPRVKTSAGMVMGTVTYMSPEQALGHEVDHRTDIFSLGIVLYEIASGRHPFTGQTAIETIDRIAHAQPDAISRFTYDIPTELERVIRKCLEKDRERRYQTAHDLFIDLKNFQRDSIEQSVAPEKKETATGRMAEKSRLSVHRALVVALALAVLAFLSVGFYWLMERGGRAKIDSVAVMPFSYSGGNADSEYLSDGITETLINKLAQLSGMKVIARNSVFRYKGRDVDAPTVGRELGVEAVLTGRIVQRGDDLLISVELVHAGDNTHLWGEQYNRKFSNILLMQAEIARDISERLRVRLSGEDERRLARRPTENPEAYQLYLRGRFFWNKRTLESFNKSIECFNQAIQLDPGYALAYAGLADSYTLLSTYGFLPPHEAYPRALAAALKAVELDDTLAEAHNSLSAIKSEWEWDWAGSLRESERAIELNPNSATAHMWYAQNLSLLGRHQEAIREIYRARELDPYSLITNSVVGSTYFLARQYDEAIAQGQRVIEMDPNFAQVYQMLAKAYEQKAMYREALAAYQKRDFLMGIGTDEELTRPEYYPEMSRREYWQRRLDKMRRAKRTKSFEIAQSLAQAGEPDEAFEWLERAYQERGFGLVYLKVAPNLDPLREDPRFKDLLRRMGLPQN